MSILHWLARRDETSGDALGRAPGEHGVRRELSAVIGDNHAGSTPSRHERRQLAHDPLAGDRRVGDRKQAFAGRVVDHVQDAEAPPAGELVVHEIEPPARVGTAATTSGARRPRPPRQDGRRETDALLARCGSAVPDLGARHADRANPRLDRAFGTAAMPHNSGAPIGQLQILKVGKERLDLQVHGLREQPPCAGAARSSAGRRCRRDDGGGRHC